jgi:hypothetical protein
MLLLRTDKLPEDDRWLYELRLDRYRAIAFRSHGKPQLRSRNDNDFTVRYASLMGGLSRLPSETVIDGEVVAMDHAAPRWSTPAKKSGLWLEVYTPLSWVSQQAAIATREYREFFVTPEMLAPVVRSTRIPTHRTSSRPVCGRNAIGAARRYAEPPAHRHGATARERALRGRDEERGRRLADLYRQEVTFALGDVHRLFAEGEFDIIVVGTAGEKRYTVKRKHFGRLPM